MADSETLRDISWKEKYLSQLETYERHEQNWARLEDIFKRALSRVTLAAEGVSAQLDEQLSKLRDALRRGVDPVAFEAQLEALSAVLLASEGSGEKAMRSPGSALASLVEHLQWPRSLRGDARRMRKRLAGLRYPGELEALLPDLRELFTRALVPAEEAKGGGGGLLGGLFGSASKAAVVPSDQSPSSSLEPACAAIEVLLDGLSTEDDDRRRQVEVLRERLDEASTLDDVQQLARDLARWFGAGVAAPVGAPGEPASAAAPSEISPNELIIQLLERLSLPAELDAKVSGLREQLLAPVARESWSGILQGVCDLVADMRRKVQKEKEDLEKFLAQLTTRLQELDERVQGTRSDHEAARRSGEALNVAVSAQVNGIAESFDLAADPGQLKRTIQDRLDEIRRHMDAYRDAESARHQQTDERMQALLHRLHELETEAESLRARVHAQRSQALRDTLTGIYNRLAYDERIEQEYARWKRFQEPVSIMVWDVDNFKSINDTYGHKAGDKVLASIAKLLASQIRETDFIARYGGEEFVIIAPGSSVQTSLALAEKLRQSVAQKVFKYRDTVVPVTISCGIAEFGAGGTPDATFERADEALYLAKQQGRNRCLVA